MTNESKSPTTVLDHPTVGHLEFDEDGQATATLMFGNTPVRLDIIFPKGEVPTAEALAEPARQLTNLATFDANARKAITEDLALGEDGEAVDLYKTHHFEEVDADALAERFGVAELEAIDDARFVAGLTLHHVGLFPKGSDTVFVFDYTVGADLTQYVIAIEFDSRMQVRSIAMES